MVFQMVNSSPSQIEPFVDRASGEQASAIFRVGYRTTDSGDILAAVDIPVDVLEQKVASDLKLVTTVTPGGEVRSVVLDSCGLAPLRPPSVISIHQLISHAVSPDNLRLEEVSINELRRLLKILELAADSVRNALGQVCCGTESKSAKAS